MAANTRTEEQREQDLERISEMYVRGFRQTDIAKEIGVSREQIKYDLADIRKRWRESTIRNFNAAKEEELSRLDAVEQEAWDAWRRSQQEQQTTEAEVKPGKSDAERTSRTKLIKRTSYGDARFLSVVRDCIARRCQILGLDAPKETRLTGKDGGPIETKGEMDLKGLTTDELQQYQHILTKLAVSDTEGVGAGNAGD